MIVRALRQRFLLFFSEDHPRNNGEDDGYWHGINDDDDVI